MRSRKRRRRKMEDKLNSNPDNNNNKSAHDIPAFPATASFILLTDLKLLRYFVLRCFTAVCSPATLVALQTFNQAL
ncbi:unnamed protein product [Merluccius merluccius]